MMSVRSFCGACATALCALAACAPVPRLDARQSFDDQALAEFRGLGVGTLPARFDVGLTTERSRAIEALSARDVDVRDALLTILKGSDVNVLVDEDVRGTASFDIKAASVEETFEALLESFDLAYRWDGRFLRVESTTSRVFDVDYPGRELAASNGLGSENVGAANPVASADLAQQNEFWQRLERDLAAIASNQSVVVNRRVGTVAVEGRPSVVRRVGAYIDEVRRRASRQVSIEARILEVTLRNEFRAGVDWSLLPGFFNSSKTGTLPGGAIVSQGASSGQDTFRVGMLNAGQFSLLIDALEVQGQVRILSSPRVSTLHNVPAEIRVVEQVPVIEREIIDSDGVSRTQFSVRFEDAGVVVAVTPQIGEDGVITAHVRPSIVEVSGFVTTPDQLVSEPILNTREVTTVLRIPDGQPIVLGGLRSERKSESLDKVPLLGDVPILGQLFRTTTQERQDVELIVMLTPRILTRAWEDEDARRSLERIRRVRRPYRGTTVSMNDDLIGLEDWAMTGRVSTERPGEDAAKRRVVADEGGAAGERAASVTPSGLARLAFRRAVQAFEAGDVRRALEESRAAVHMDAGLADAWLLIASIEFGRERVRAARGAFERVLALRPGDVHAQNGLGRIALRNGAAIRAEALFAAVVEKNASAELHNNLGVALLAQGRVAEARTQFEAALARDRGLGEAQLNLAVCHERAGDALAAVESYRRFVAGGGSLDARAVRPLRARIERLLHARPNETNQDPLAEPAR